jgi:hypothetical protein
VPEHFRDRIPSLQQHLQFPRFLTATHNPDF